MYVLYILYKKWKSKRFANIIFSNAIFTASQGIISEDLPHPKEKKIPHSLIHTKHNIYRYSAERKNRIDLFIEKLNKQVFPIGRLTETIQ